MVEHTASVEIAAPVANIYELFSHFNDYPRFMSHVREVTCRPDGTSHWVVEMSGAGKYEWDARNEGWEPQRRIGWASTSGLVNGGNVMFEPISANASRIIVTLWYDPPAGVLGDMAESLGVGGSVERQVQHDLERFASIVLDAQVSSDDPEWAQRVFRNHAGEDRIVESQRGSVEDDNDEVAAAQEYRTGVPIIP